MESKIKLVEHVDSKQENEITLLGVPTNQPRNKSRPKYSITLNQFAYFIDVWEIIENDK